MRWSSIIGWQCTRRVVPSLSADNAADWQPSPPNTEFNYRSGSCVSRRSATASPTNFSEPGRGRLGCCCCSKSAALIPRRVVVPQPATATPPIPSSTDTSAEMAQVTVTRWSTSACWDIASSAHRSVSVNRTTAGLEQHPSVSVSTWTGSAAVQHCQHKGSYLLFFFFFTWK